MKRLNSIILAALLAGCVQAYGCVFVQSSAISDRAGAGNPISSSASELGFLHLVAPQGLTQTALSNLLSNCATGKVSGVTTELTMRDFFIVQSYNVSVSGTCS
ncbi:MAG TPA: hypothetical protein VJX68_08425 [Candidatus Binatus sp.]|uniref:hypothetical protein n=1 Tax=Candidatus Binatus sp. TaxID=2811406 RepID=UPI002B474C69|nr:hypothetical protein [Candidatus Binatus sp.]HKN13208.1 hypothetical protein [Candidatus Binatus sp.]